MNAVNLTPHFPESGSVIAGKWRITLCKVKSSDWTDVEVLYYRADNYSAISVLMSTLKKKVPIKIELVGVYYYELYFDLEEGKDDLPLDLSVFLYCLY